MRLTPILLIVIGIFTFMHPEKMLADGESTRWVSLVLIALGVILIARAWFAARKKNQNK